MTLHAKLACSLNSIAIVLLLIVLFGGSPIRLFSQHQCFNKINNLHVNQMVELDSVVWLATAESGLVSHSLHSILSTTYDATSSIIDSNFVRSVVVYDNTIIASTDKNLYQLKNGQLALYAMHCAGELAVATGDRLVVAGDSMYYEIVDQQIVYSKDLTELVTWSCSICDKSTDVSVGQDGTRWITHFGFYEFDVLEFDGTSWTLHDHTTTSVLPRESFNKLNRIHSSASGVHATAYGGYRFDGSNWFHGLSVQPTVNQDGDTIRHALTDIQAAHHGGLWIGTFYNNDETQNLSRETSLRYRPSLLHFDGSRWMEFVIPADTLSTVTRILIVDSPNSKVFVGTTSGTFVASLDCLQSVSTVFEATSVANIKVVPNPAHGFINIANVECAMLDVVDFLGKIVKTVSSTNANGIESVDLSGVPHGTYILRCQQRSDNVSTIVVVQ